MTPSAAPAADLPVLPHVEVGVQHLVLDDNGSRGDWSATVALDNGDVGLVVGDVVGRSGSAQNAMHRLSAISRHLLEDGTEPEDVLTALDTAARRHTDVRGASALVATISPPTGRLHAAHRGHLPPLVVNPETGTRMLEIPPSAPLGVPGASTTHDDVLYDEDVIILFTDGLVERPAMPLDRGIAHLRRVAASVISADSPAAPIDTLAAAVFDRVADRLKATTHDEALLLVARYSAAPVADLHLPDVSVPSGLGAVRAHILDWLTQVGAGEDDRFALVQATSEALANLDYVAAVTEREARVALDATLTPAGVVRMSIHDDSDWSQALETRDGEEGHPGARLPLSDRNRALILMLDLVDDMQVERLLVGTHVVLEKIVTRAPVHRTAPPVGPRAQATDLEVRAVRVGTPTVLAVSGPIDDDSVEAFRLAVVAAMGTQVEPVVLDLTEVTLLGGVGIRLLHTWTSDGVARLEVAPESAVAAVLEMTAVPHLGRPDTRRARAARPQSEERRPPTRRRHRP